MVHIVYTSCGPIGGYMLKTPLLNREIWKLKNQNQKPEDKSIPPNLMDSPVYQRNLKDEKIFRMASESAEEEFKTFELPIIIKEFEEWQKKNPSGNWKQFYNLYLRVSLLGNSIPPWDRPEDYEEEIIEEEPTIKVAELPKSKINEIIKIKKIDLTPDFLKLIDSFSKLPPSQRESIAWMLKRSGKK